MRKSQLKIMNRSIRQVNGVSKLRFGAVLR